jgi:phospholipid/cholesterol/gamma-HCH transport system permease protein
MAQFSGLGSKLKGYFHRSIKDAGAVLRELEAGQREAFAISVASRTFDEIYLNVSGRIDMENAAHFRKKLFEIIEAEPLRNVVVDLERVEYFDSGAAVILREAHEKCCERNNSLKVINVSAGIQSFLGSVDRTECRRVGILEPRAAPHLLVQIGEGTLKLYQTTRDILTFIGASAAALAHDLTHPRTLRWEGLWDLISKAGSDAIPIVGALSLLLGAIMAFQAAIQLRKFGANIFVADLVSLSISIEMGPLLTAMIAAGRSGAAYAAHIGTMQVTEEVDALRVMAIDPVRYLVSPRIIALALVLPCLTLFADFVGILGGCIVAVLSLDLTPTTYFSQTGKVLELTDIGKGLSKSLAYGIEIAMIGCLRGFQVKGGAEGVGSATTSAVVTSIFVIVVTDAIFSMLFHYVRFL